MSGWVAALVSMALVVNPIGVGRAAVWSERDTAWRNTVAPILAAAAAALAALGLLTAPVLSLIDVTTPTFRLSAALVMGVTGLVWMLRPTKPVTDLGEASAWTVLGATMLLTPGPVFTAMAANGDGGTAAGLVAVGLAMVLVAAAVLGKRMTDPMASWAAQLTGSGAVITAAAIGLDAARTV
ncbi:MAG: hypothetical protein AAF480_20230 [Actinomycetota bacterium]